MKNVIIAIVLICAFIISLFMNITPTNKLMIGAVCLFGAVVMLTNKKDEN